jgi:hypothetical protein
MKVDSQIVWAIEELAAYCGRESASSRIDKEIDKKLLLKALAG